MDAVISGQEKLLARRTFNPIHAEIAKAVITNCIRKKLLSRIMKRKLHKKGVCN
jgi:hypothetical protein